MKGLLITICLIVLLGSVHGQKSYTYDFGVARDDALTITVGDVYRKVLIEGNPWQDTVWVYVTIVDIKDGWVKYNLNKGFDERITDLGYSYDLVNDFYLYYIYRGELYKKKRR